MVAALEVLLCARTSDTHSPHTKVPVLTTIWSPPCCSAFPLWALGPCGPSIETPYRPRPLLRQQAKPLGSTALSQWTVTDAEEGRYTFLHWDAVAFLAHARLCVCGRRWGSRDSRSSWHEDAPTSSAADKQFKRRSCQWSLKRAYRRHVQGRNWERSVNSPASLEAWKSLKYPDITCTAPGEFNAQTNRHLWARMTKSGTGKAVENSY